VRARDQSASYRAFAISAASPAKTISNLFSRFRGKFRPRDAGPASRPRSAFRPRRGAPPELWVAASNSVIAWRRRARVVTVVNERRPFENRNSYPANRRRAQRTKRSSALRSAMSRGLPLPAPPALANRVTPGTFSPGALALRDLHSQTTIPSAPRSSIYCAMKTCLLFDAVRQQPPRRECPNDANPRIVRH